MTELSFVAVGCVIPAGTLRVNDLLRFTAHPDPRWRVVMPSWSSRDGGMLVEARSPARALRRARKQGLA